MDTQTARNLLDGFPIYRSDYEFKNFHLELYGTFPRQLKAMLTEKEELSYQLTHLEVELELMNLETLSGSPEKVALNAKRNAVIKDQLNREIKGVTQKLSQVDNWLDSQDIDLCKEAIEEFEDYESDHWTEMLGREAAIEILSHGRTQKNTLQQLSQLPLGDFKKAVIFIAQLSNFLKDTTQQAEATIFPENDTIPNGDVTIKGDK